MMGLVRNISPRAWRIWRRHLDVYFVTWKTNLMPPVLEPILYLAAFGAGVGAMVKVVSFRGQEVSYSAFIAPGLLATQVMFQSFFESTYSTFVRMYWQKTFDAVLATPLTIEDIMFGELLWGATKGTLGCILMMAVISGFGLLHYPEVLWIVPFSFMAGLFFSGVGLCVTGIVPKFDSFNFSTFLFIMPMFLFSGTFFPIDVLPPWAQFTAQLLPLTHVVNFMRALSLGQGDASVFKDALYLLALTPPVGLLGIYLMKKRIVK